MGLTRKVLSLSTLGAVDFRSDKERTAAYTRGARAEARKQTVLMRKQTKMMREELATAQREQAALAAQAVAQAPQVAPEGWYPDSRDASLVRWWDGARWTSHTHPR